jgi:hypothetical protein
MSVIEVKAEVRQGRGVEALTAKIYRYLRFASVSVERCRYGQRSVSLSGTRGRTETGKAWPLCPGPSDINLFCYRQGIINLDAEISDGALDLGVTEQDLHRPKIAGAPVNKRCLSSPKRMGPKEVWIQPDVGNPLRNEPSILPGGHAPFRATPPGKHKLARLLGIEPYETINSLPGLLC